MATTSSNGREVAPRATIRPPCPYATTHSTPQPISPSAGAANATGTRPGASRDETDFSAAIAVTTRPDAIARNANLSTSTGRGVGRRPKRPTNAKVSVPYRPITCDWIVQKCRL